MQRTPTPCEAGSQAEVLGPARPPLMGMMFEQNASTDVTRLRGAGAAGNVGALALVVGDVLFTAGASAGDPVVARSQVPAAQVYLWSNRSLRVAMEVLGHSQIS